MGLTLRYSLNAYADVRSRAGNCLEGALRRYPALVSAVLPTLLRSLAGLEDEALISGVWRSTFLTPYRINAEPYRYKLARAVSLQTGSW